MHAYIDIAVNYNIQTRMLYAVAAQQSTFFVGELGAFHQSAYRALITPIFLIIGIIINLI